MAKTLRDKKINQIIYISIGGAIAAVILFIIFFNIFGNRSSSENSNIQFGQNKDGYGNSSEQASSSIGKNVEEAKEENNDESVQVKVDDKEKSEGQAGQSQSANSNNVTGNANGESNVNNGNSSNENCNTDTTETIESFTDEDIDVSANQVEQQEQVQDPTFTMPVEGEVAKHYGKDKLIYSDTLKEWTTHLGIDIKADKTTVVKASADGSVKSIKNDPRYGLTIVVEHQNGFTSVYSNLLSAEFVVTGETVKAGQTLGTVGNSATFEILDDSHLHFEILKDGESVDPEMYIK